MKKLNNLINLNQISILLLIFPYIGHNWIEFMNSPFYNEYFFTTFLLTLIGIDIILKIIIDKFQQSKKLISSLIILTIPCFFYGGYFVNTIYAYIKDLTGVEVRMRYIFFFLFMILIILLIHTIRNQKSFKGLNIFLLFFSVISLSSNVLGFNKTSVTSLDKHKQYSYNSIRKNVKPVLLIITDEYSSPENLYDFFKDSSLFNFTKSLKNDNWIVRTKFLTYETSTIHSLGSAFNFNLSENKDFNKSSKYELGFSKFVKSALFDSLKRKNISITNFGIFDFGNQNSLNKIYYYPKSFTQHLFSYTLYEKIVQYSNYASFEYHNKDVLANLFDTLSNLHNPKNFVYAHLLMPHPSFFYASEFPFKKDNIYNYKSFWEFTNQKLTSLLKELTKENKYRIILSGDHGYRGNKAIDAQKTFCAFYGFNSSELSQIKTVQDLGFLINNNF